jgi:hypothetical protein
MAMKSGTKLVIGTVTATLIFVGIGAIYLPFFADRDKLRGMHEEADGGMSDRQRQEYEKFVQKIQQQRQLRDETSGGLPSGNSMWSRMNQAASDKKDE